VPSAGCTLLSIHVDAWAAACSPSHRGFDILSLGKAGTQSAGFQAASDSRVGVGPHKGPQVQCLHVAGLGNTELTTRTITLIA